MILLRIVHVIPQKSDVCDSYITDKKSIYAGGGCIPDPPPRSATARLYILLKIVVLSCSTRTAYDKQK